MAFFATPNGVRENIFTHEQAGGIEGAVKHQKRLVCLGIVLMGLALFTATKLGLPKVLPKLLLSF